MSWGGLLAGAIGGAANVIGKQAGDDIEQSRKAELMRQQADIEEQMRNRLAERQTARDKDMTLWKTQGEGGTAALDFSRRAEEQSRKGLLQGKIEEATNPELTAAKDTQAEAELQRDIRKIKETAKPEAEKAALIAEARARSEAKYRKADPTVESKVSDIEKVLGRKLTETEKLAAIGLAKGRDPELDTQTVTEEKMNPDGTVTKTSRKEVRRAGQGGQSESAPYPDGTELKGKDGQVYVVQGGQPVLKNKPEAPKKTGLLSTAEPVAKSPKALAREEYLRELEILDQMKNGTQTPTRNRSLIPAQEAKVNRLLQAAQ